jgi:nucleotide-binding universal stress UspA family protein
MVMEPVLRHAQRRAEKAVEKVKKMGDDAGVEVEVEVLEGDPVHVIEDYIKKHYRDIDTVVMGSGRKSRLERLLSGSISKKVIERVAEDVYCPIMIVTQE